MKNKLLLVCIFFSCYAYPRENYLTAPDVVLKLYQIMKDAHEVLQSYQIPYWSHAGTLLGAVRHNGIIPWDDDLDIVIEREHEPAFVKILPIFELLGYRILIVDSAYQLTYYEKSENHTWIDVMIFEKIDKKYSYPKHLGTPSHWFFMESDVFPLKKYRFGEIEINGPRNPIPYLNQVYHNWQTEGVMYNHQNSHMQTVALSSNMQEPARPTGPLKDRTSGLNNCACANESKK